MIICRPRATRPRAVRRARRTHAFAGPTLAKREDQLVVVLMNLKNDGGPEPKRGVLHGLAVSRRPRTHVGGHAALHALLITDYWRWT
ncbi:hypothetical protein FE633_11125 [Streptomyces montanus]|uniref:Uncharacterized protein n=1 Tax=Streptomyces montanus TaxID=2580423 RepID=A0A5R9FRT6_9ACTN|nr:hypothetical protein [Streptomyces montanus]TLS46091.1 hypothetical protein FE633_11125 [Streptomyces montanus]